MISIIKIDIDTTEGETWFGSWKMDSNSFTVRYQVCLHIIKNDNIIKTYRIELHVGNFPDVPYIEIEKKHIQFPVLRNISGRFYTSPYNSVSAGDSAWLYDVNKDGYDEIISVIIIGSDIGSDYPKALLEIAGYDRDKDEFVSYLDIYTITVDEETGPDPVQYVQNQGYWGFRCLIDGSDYTPIYGIPAVENENFTWVFFVWDSEEKKYIEKMFIEE
jgi:hypothetical protein